MTIKTGDNEMKPSANGRWLHSPSARVTDNPQGALIAYMKLEYQRNPEGFPYLFPNIRAMRSYLQSATRLNSSNGSATVATKKPLIRLLRLAIIFTRIGPMRDPRTHPRGRTGSNSGCRTSRITHPNSRKLCR